MARNLPFPIEEQEIHLPKRLFVHTREEKPTQKHHFNHTGIEAVIINIQI